MIEIGGGGEREGVDIEVEMVDVVGGEVEVVVGKWDDSGVMDVYVWVRYVVGIRGVGGRVGKGRGV